MEKVVSEIIVSDHCECYHCIETICRANQWDRSYVMVTVAWYDDVNV